MECPACGYENLPGADTCEACGSSMTQIDLESEASKTIAELLKEKKISDLDSGKPIFCKMGESIDEAVRKMQDANVAHVLVTNDAGDLKGIVTERDILYNVLPTKDGEESAPIESIMTPNPHTLKGDDSVSVLLNTMSVYGYRRVPVQLDDGYAMVTVRQLFNYLLALESE